MLSASNHLIRGKLFFAQLWNVVSEHLALLPCSGVNASEGFGRDSRDGGSFFCTAPDLLSSCHCAGDRGGFRWPQQWQSWGFGKPKMQVMLMPCLIALAAVGVHSLWFNSLKDKGVFCQGYQLCASYASLERNPGGRGAAEAWLEPLVFRTRAAEERGLCFGAEGTGKEGKKEDKLRGLHLVAFSD